MLGLHSLRGQGDTQAVLVLVVLDVGSAWFAAVGETFFFLQEMTNNTTVHRLETI